MDEKEPMREIWSIQTKDGYPTAIFSTRRDAVQCLASWGSIGAQDWEIVERKTTYAAWKAFRESMVAA